MSSPNEPVTFNFCHDGGVGTRGYYMKIVSSTGSRNVYFDYLNHQVGGLTVTFYDSSGKVIYEWHSYNSLVSVDFSVYALGGEVSVGVSYDNA